MLTANADVTKSKEINSIERTFNHELRLAVAKTRQNAGRQSGASAREDVSSAVGAEDSGFFGLFVAPGFFIVVVLWQFLVFLGHFSRKGPQPLLTPWEARRSLRPRMERTLLDWFLTAASDTPAALAMSFKVGSPSGRGHEGYTSE